MARVMVITSKTHGRELSSLFIKHSNDLIPEPGQICRPNIQNASKQPTQRALLGGFLLPTGHIVDTIEHKLGTGLHFYPAFLQTVSPGQKSQVFRREQHQMTRHLVGEPVFSE